jgi:nitrate reductase gamma subunit
MTWTAILEFLRGPLFQAALLIFIVGMMYRLTRLLMLGQLRGHGWTRPNKVKGIGQSYLKGLLILPFIPSVKYTLNGNVVTFLAGGLFHLGLFVIIFLGTPHMLVWKSLLGFGWPTIPTPIVDWLAAGAIVALMTLAINRLIHPVLKLLTGPADWVNLALVFLPMVTGYMMAHHLWFRYEVLYSLHMLTVDVLLIWIPMSRISHLMFYFFSRTLHGTEFSKVA